MLALIDADILCYEQGFASQQTIYHANGRAYETKEDAKKENGKDVVLVPEIIPMHKSAAYKMVRERVDSIIEATGADDYECYLTGGGNFRDKVATIAKYKGNRSAPRPFHYQNIRDYLTSKYNARVIHGMEADDMVAIRQTQIGGDSVICSRDKDLRQVPGMHYTWSAGKQAERPMYHITEEEGNLSLCKQWLMGDATDNIIGLPGIGERKAEKILSEASGNDWHSLSVAVIETYNKELEPIIGEGGLVYYQGWDGTRHWRTPNAIAQENYCLVHMKRSL